MSGKGETAIAFGPVGIAGWALLVLGVVLRRRLIAMLGLAGVVADVTVAELGGFKAMNGIRATDGAPVADDELVTDL